MRVFGFSAAQIGSFRLLYRPAPVNLSQRRCAVKPVNAEPKRNDSIVPLAVTIAAPGELCVCVCVFSLNYN